MNEVILPLDLPQLPQFMKLVRFMSGDVGRAMHAWYILWQQFAYRVQEGATAGRLPESERETLIGAWAPVVPTDAADGYLDKLVTFMVDDMKLLILDGGDMVCQRFAALYGNTSAFGMSREAKGGVIKAYNAKNRKAEESMLELGLMIKPEKYKDGDNNPLTSHEIERVNWLIIRCDNALDKPERPAFGFDGALIANAAAVIRKFNDEQIKAVTKEIRLHRAHPLIAGMTTERLLPQFCDIMPQMSAIAA